MGLMALSSVTAGAASAATDINQYKDHLEGGSGKTVAWHFIAAPSNNITLEMADAAGSQKVTFTDSAQVEVARIDSNGNLQLDGTMTLGAVAATTGTVITHEAGGMEFDASAVTTGGIVRGASSGVMELLGIGSTGHILTVVGGQASWAASTTFVDKTADETVNNSSTLQNDNHLTFPIAANKNYAVWGSLLGISGTTPDFKVQWAMPGSSTFDYNMAVQTNAGNGAVQWATEAAAHLVDGATANKAYLFTGVMIADGSGGTVTLQWAQNTADSSDTKLLTGSWLAYQLLN
jgi:hypothetical protein